MTSMAPTDESKADREALIRGIQADLVAAGASSARIREVEADTDADRARAAALARELAGELARIAELRGRAAP